MPNENDLTGIPDVDLSQIKEEVQQEIDEANEQATQPQGSPQALPRQDVNLDQFKRPEDMLKSYKEIQAAFTKVTQENKELREKIGNQNPERSAQLESEMAALKEKLEQYELAGYQQPPQAQKPQKNFEDMWIESPESAIAQKVVEQIALQRINDVLEEEDMKDPSSFQARYGYANMLAKNPQFSHLAKTPQGVRKLFQMGDKLRKEQLKQTTSQALESLFGEPLAPEEIAKLRDFVKGGKAKKTNQNTNNAYMPDTSTSTQTGADVGTGPDKDAMIRTAVEKGDLDGVLQGMFKDILAE